MLATFFIVLAQGQYKFALEAAFTFLISFAPLVVERLARIKLPPLYHLIYVAFVFGSMFTGEVLSMYGRWWPYDDWVHFASGIVLGLATFVVLRFYQARAGWRLASWLIVAAMIAVNCTISMAWELVEFASDAWFGTFSQGADLVDTMIDMRNGLFGAALTAALAALYLGGRPSLGFGWLVSRLERYNPELKKS